MINQQLLDYIKQCLQQGISKDVISNNLTQQGWQVASIEEAFNSLTPSIQSVALGSASPRPSPLESPKKGLNKAWLVAIFVIVGILIIGGGAFAYFNYFQTPEKIIQKMAERLTEVKSLEYSGEIKVEADVEALLSDSGDSSQSATPSPEEKVANFSINFTGSSDLQKLDDPKGTFSLNIRTNALPEGEFTFGLEIIAIGKIVYVKLGDMPNLEDLDLSAIENQWIKIDTETLGKQFGLVQTEEQFESTLKEQGLSPEEIEKLKTVFEQARIFKITEKLASEKIEGVNMYHYKFAIDREGIKSLFREIIKIQISKNVQDGTLTEEGLASFDKNLEAIEWPEGEIWIGKKDLLPYKISLSTIIKEADQSKISGKIDFVLSFKNFNKPVQIDIPAQAKSFEEVLEEFLGEMQALAPNNALPNANQQEFDKDTDGDGISDQWEAVFGTDPNKADTDGDGISDTEELKRDADKDTDGDTIPDQMELLLFKTDPNKADTDGDGYTDAEELEKGYNPNGEGKL